MFRPKQENFTEKYAPKTLDEVLGQDEAISKIKNATQNGPCPNLLFYGPPGSGKSTVARIVARSLKASLLDLNASDERGIDVIREKVKNFARARGVRVALLDEADSLTDDAMEALRGIMTPPTKSDCIFILTANRVNKIIEPIQSRCLKIFFKPISDNTILSKLLQICLDEPIDMSSGDAEDQLSIIVKASNGDLRKAIILLQNSVINGILIRTIIKDSPTKGLMKIALDKALSGDIKAALEYAEDAAIAHASPDELVLSICDAINQLEGVDQQIRARLLIKLGDFDFRIRMGGVIVVHVGAFLSWAWILPHMSKCPALQE